MKSQWLFTLATILLLVGVISLAISWHGSLSVTGAFPTSSSSVQLTGAARGGWAVVGLFCFLGGLGLLVVSVVRAFLELFRKKPSLLSAPRSSPASPTPSSAAKPSSRQP